jgi:hypothetical protein
LLHYVKYIVTNEPPGPTHELDHEPDTIKMSRSVTNITNKKILNENEMGRACPKHGTEEKCI